MTRSPDDIFAAQMWAWPDPAFKRDAHGRVLFVNAAFLQLFGGTVETWRGQTIPGWNPPQPGFAPARFEIRIPATEHAPEQVYDWLEQMGRDGNAFVLARNVTAFLSVPQPVAPVMVEPAAPAELTHGAAEPVAAQPVMADPAPPLDPSAYVAAAVQEPVAEPPQPFVQQAPAVPRTEATAPAPDPIPVAPAPVVPTPATQAVPETPEPIAVAPAPPPAVDPVAAPTPAPVEPVQAEAVPPAASEPEPERDFERRALPIENDEALLGNNWRDAVIAKAIGGEEETPSEPALMTDESASETASGDGIRILLAEDNAINALLTRTLLEADGHTVETVEDGQLAVEAMKTSTYDMIFMDMRMPNMDGLEATRHIRRLSNVPQDLPIVALTANAFDDDRNACFDSGMNDFMTKPVSAEELSEMVVRWTTESERKMAS